MSDSDTDNVPQDVQETSTPPVKRRHRKTASTSTPRVAKDAVKDYVETLVVSDSNENIFTCPPFFANGDSFNAVNIVPSDKFKENFISTRKPALLKQIAYILIYYFPNSRDILLPVCSMSTRTLGVPYHQQMYMQAFKKAKLVYQAFDLSDRMIHKKSKDEPPKDPEVKFAADFKNDKSKDGVPLGKDCSVIVDNYARMTARAHWDATKGDKVGDGSYTMELPDIMQEDFHSVRSSRYSRMTDVCLPNFAKRLDILDRSDNDALNNLAFTQLSARRKYCPLTYAQASELAHQSFDPSLLNATSLRLGQEQYRENKLKQKALKDKAKGNDVKESSKDSNKDSSKGKDSSKDTKDSGNDKSKVVMVVSANDKVKGTTTPVPDKVYPIEAVEDKSEGAPEEDKSDSE